MNNFECPLCYEKYDNPLECLQCHNNFCKKHLPNLNNKCPMCNTIPLRYTENTWLRRTVMNMNLNECTLCGFEGDERSFWSHLIESHKAEVIAQFKKKFIIITIKIFKIMIQKKLKNQCIQILAQLVIQLTH